MLDAVQPSRERPWASEGSKPIGAHRVLGGSRRASPGPEPADAGVGATGFAALVLGTIAALGLLGFGVHHAGVPGAFDLDGEYDVPALWSGAVLLAAALATAAARGVLGRPAVAVAVLFAFMGVDEVLSLHEELEQAVGVDWQLLYLPLVALGGLGWLSVLRRLGDGRRAAAGTRVPEAAWVLGGLAWGVAQLLERWEWDGDVKLAHYYPKMYVEETLEMLGSAAWLGAMLLLLGLLRHHRRPGHARTA